MADPWTHAWEEAAASAPANIIDLIAIELNHSAFRNEADEQIPIRAVSDLVDKDLPIENGAPFDAGTTVTFKAIPFRFYWPGVDENKVPEIEVIIDHVGRELSPYLSEAARTNQAIQMIVRAYSLNMDDGSVAATIDPFTMYLRSVVVTETEVTGRASPGDLANKRALRLVYDIKTYPSLTYNE